MEKYCFERFGREWDIRDEKVLNQLEVVLAGFAGGKEIVKLNETPDGRFLKTAISVCRYDKDVDRPHAKNRYLLEDWLIACVTRVGEVPVDNSYGIRYGKDCKDEYIGMRAIEFSKGYVGSRLNGMPSTPNELVNARVHHMKNRVKHLEQINGVNAENAKRKIVEGMNADRLSLKDDVMRDRMKVLFGKCVEFELALDGGKEVCFDDLMVLKRNLDDAWGIMCNMVNKG